MFLRNFFKNNIKYLVKLLIKDKYKITIGKIIRFIHIYILYIVFLTLFFIDKKYIKYMFIFIIFVIILFILNDFGCIISILETELLENDYNHSDICLNLINLQINKNHRIIMTLFNFFIQLYILILLYYFKK